MKFSWSSIKISIAGAKLSHLVQKDRIWDHGSMAEQARIIFYLVHKAKASGNINSLKKQCSDAAFEKLIAKIEEAKQNSALTTSPIVKEIAIIDVRPGKNNKPDRFNTLIKYYFKETSVGKETIDLEKEFAAKWCFIRQGEWWVLNEIK